MANMKNGAYGSGTDKGEYCGFGTSFPSTPENLVKSTDSKFGDTKVNKQAGGLKSATPPAKDVIGASAIGKNSKK